MTFILGDESFKVGKKSLKALKSHAVIENGRKQAVYLVINSKLVFGKSRSHTPRIIPVTHKLEEVENKSILLITKDPSTDYRDELTKKDCITEDVFNQIYSLKKLRVIGKDPKKLFKQFKEFDLIIADHRVHKFLPDILGGSFYIKNKKVPFMVQMAKPSADAQLVKSKKSSKMKDNRCEPKYIYSQVKSIIGNTNFIAANGNCITVKVGYTEWKEEDVLQNISDVVSYLTEEKYKPVGGILKTIDNIGSIFLKTSESISLPLYKTQEIEAAEDDSDFDF